MGRVLTLKEVFWWSDVCFLAVFCPLFQGINAQSHIRPHTGVDASHGLTRRWGMFGTVAETTSCQRFVQCNKTNVGGGGGEAPVEQ